MSICLRRLFAFALLFLSLATGRQALAEGRPVPLLSVAVTLGQRQVVLGSTRGFDIVDPAKNRALRHFGPGGRVRLRSRGKGIGFGGKMTLLRLVVRPVAGSLLQLNGNAFRGYFEIREDPTGKICVANILDVESYLYGVVKSEMPGGAPLAALETQAIISRTFALKNRDNFSERGFGLKATEESQVYVGVRGESAASRQAVDATRGIVLSYSGQLASTFYSAMCGGATESNEVVWGGTTEPYLQPVACGFCRGCPNFHWQAELTFDDMARKLKAAGVPVGQIKRVELVQTPGGRVRTVRLSSTRGEVEVNGNKFRLAMGHRKVRSQRFALVQQFASAGDAPRDDDGYDRSESAIREVIHSYVRETVSATRASSGGRLRLMGTGYGHGVGLCQWGAKEQAERGRSYREILAFYFRGTRLARAY
ncbi:MAG: SpoIID/LytB domain-containing protein [Candidatus Riflebacteria bacterium]|nr:SpoIID/LytB domain-containing protein [Candidatus Riflebacteria bacterium]